MRNIDKKPQPLELISYKRRPDACYDGPEFTQVKEAIKRQLLQEQGYLCAYCMKRIGLDNLKVEHWHCQAVYPEEQLDYGNMLGVCLGNQGLKVKDQTCDTRKGKKDLQYNPANAEHDVERLIRYLGDGTIPNEDEDDKKLGNGEIPKKDDVFRKQLNDVLNLNHTRLVKNRKEVVLALSRELCKKPGTRTRQATEKLLKKWLLHDRQGKLPEYSGVAIYFLKKRLRTPVTGN